MFCAICTSDRGPFVRRPLGRGDALVNVCADCDEQPAREVRGPELAYEPPCSPGTTANAKAPAPLAHHELIAATHEQMPGWRTVRIAPRDALGNRRDQRDAWIAVGDKRARLVAVTPRGFVYQVPPKVELASDENPLAAIEQYRSEVG